MLVLKKCRGEESQTFKKKGSSCGIAVFSNVSSKVYIRVRKMATCGDEVWLASVEVPQML